MNTIKLKDKNMQYDSSHKVALITGAARRIGADIARTLHAHQINVILHYHTSQREAEMLCTELNQKRPNSAVAISADLLDIDHLPKLIKQSADVWNRLDILVNNASRFYRTLVGNVGQENWDDLLTANLKAPFFLSQAAVPYLAKQQGCIINITDIRAEKPLRGYPVYCISKAGLAMLTKSLALELAPQVRVNAVAPGVTIWAEGENALSPELKERIIDHTALKKESHPNYIAQAVLFLVDQASYMTGQVVTVDGGRLLF